MKLTKNQVGSVVIDWDAQDEPDKLARVLVSRMTQLGLSPKELTERTRVGSTSVNQRLGFCNLTRDRMAATTLIDFAKALNLNWLSILSWGKVDVDDTEVMAYIAKAEQAYERQGQQRSKPHRSTAGILDGLGVEAVKTWLEALGYVVLEGIG